MSRCVCTLPDRDEDACAKCPILYKDNLAMIPVDLDRHVLTIDDGVYTIRLKRDEPTSNP